LSELEQAKRKDKKVYITDIAISKVPFVKYKGFDDSKNEIMRNLAMDLLLVSKDENDSNEVAFTCDLSRENPLDEVGVAFGSEHEIDILSDTLSNHLIVSEKPVAVVVLHNHPSTQTFSLQDIHFFLQYTKIAVMVVVSNQGKIHYLMRDDNYNLEDAFELFKECIHELEPGSSPKDLYLSALSFLAKCSEVGLYYS